MNIKYDKMNGDSGDNIYVCRGNGDGNEAKLS